MNKISSFTDENAFLANQYPCAVVLDNELYSSVEVAFQAAKTNDPELREKIRTAKSFYEARKIGKNLTLSEDWDSRRLFVMKDLVEQKFTKSLPLKLKLLLTTGDMLVQGNSDTFWGENKWGEGENNLGKILMDVRNSLLEKEGDYNQVFIKFLKNNEVDFMLNHLDEEPEDDDDLEESDLISSAEIC